MPLSIANVQVEQEIGEYYRANPASMPQPVTQIIDRLFGDWQRTGTYRFAPDTGPEWDGDYWRQGVEGERPGLVLGFESCQAAAGNPVSKAPVETLVSWINHYYGIDPNDPGVIGPNADQKLSTAVLAAERANP